MESFKLLFSTPCFFFVILFHFYIVNAYFMHSEIHLTLHFFLFPLIFFCKYKFIFFHFLYVIFSSFDFFPFLVPLETANIWVLESHLLQCSILHKMSYPEWSKSIMMGIYRKLLTSINRLLFWLPLSLKCEFCIRTP